MQGIEKILEEIDKATDEYGMVDYINDEPVISKNQAKEIIRKHMNDGWISVEERLPEKYGKYLVTVIPPAGYLWAKTMIAYFSDLAGLIKNPIFWVGNVGKNDFENITDEVIAWQPLPEPYKAERNDNHDGE